MAIIDAKLEFSDNQDVAASTLSSGSSVNSTNLIDLRGSATYDTNWWGTSITPDIGEAGTLEWTVQVSTEATAGGTCTAYLKHSNALSTSHLSSGQTLVSLAFAAASAIGAKKTVKVPSGTINRYLEVVFTASGGAVTAGKFDSWIGLDHSTA